MKSYFSWKIPALLICLFFPVFAALGQVDEGVLFEGEEEAEEASRALAKEPESIATSPAPVTVIGKEDIRRSGARTIPEALAFLPGVGVVRRSEANVEVTIRGFNSHSANKVLVMLDGRPLFNLADASVNWHLIPVPISEVERIEVVRGPGSVLYGENAFFGTINIITATGDKSGARLAGGYGSGDSYTADAAASLPGFHASWQRQGLDRFDDGSHVPNSFLDGLREDPISAKVTVDRAYFRWDGAVEDMALSVNGGYVELNTDYDSIDADDRLGMISVETGAESNGLRVELGARFIHQEQDTDDGPFGGPGPFREFDRLDADLRGVYSPAVFDVVVFGVTLSNQTLKDDVFLESVGGEKRRINLAMYAENQLALFDNTLFITAGLRGDAYQGGRTVFSPRVGAIWLVSRKHTLKAGWGRAFRYPTLYELHGADATLSPWRFEGNESLDHECVTSYNLNYLYEDPGKLRVALDLYYQELDGLIVYKADRVTAAERIYRLHNEDEAISQGGELEASAFFAKGFEVWFNYSYNESYYTYDEEDREAPYSPRHMANLGLNWRAGPLDLALWAHYVGEQVAVNLDSPFVTRIDMNDYGTINARVEVGLGSGFSLSVAGHDIGGGGHYEALTYAPSVPWYMVEMEWEPEWQ